MGIVSRKFLIRALVVLGIAVLAVEGYYVYLFYANPVAFSGGGGGAAGAPATQAAAPPEATTPRAPETAAAEATASPDDTALRAPKASERMEEAEYLGEVGDVQAGAVRTFLDSRNKLLRHDTITAADVDEMEDNASVLGDYRDRVAGLNPPEGFEEQHELFGAAIGDLHEAAEVAHRLANDPASATQSNFDAYDLRVDRAAAGLRRSNEILGRDYETTKP